MLYQCPDGRTIRIKEDHYFRMSDEEFERFLLYSNGIELNDPFFDSSLHRGLAPLPDDLIELITEEITEDDIPGEED